MSKLLYYSNYCENSKKLLSIVVKSNIKNDIHFICVDKRVQRNNKTYIILENNNTGFWGTFGICLLLSPLLGVIIAVSSGNRAKPLSRVEKK